MYIRCIRKLFFISSLLLIASCAGPGKLRPALREAESLSREGKFQLVVNRLGPLCEELSDDEPAENRIDALLALSLAHWALGEKEGADAAAIKALNIAKKVNAAPGIRIRLNRIRSELAILEGDTASALKIASEAIPGHKVELTTADKEQLALLLLLKARILAPSQSASARRLIQEAVAVEESAAGIEPLDLSDFYLEAWKLCRLPSVCPPNMDFFAKAEKIIRKEGDSCRLGEIGMFKALSNGGGEPDRVQHELEASLEQMRSCVGVDTLKLAEGLFFLSQFLVKGKDLEKAEKLLDEATSLVRRFSGAGQKKLFDLMEARAYLLFKRGDFQGAKGLLVELVDVKKRVFGGQSKEMLLAHYPLGLVHSKLEEWGEASVQLVSAYKLEGKFKSGLGSKIEEAVREVLKGLYKEGFRLCKEGNEDRAQQDYQKAIDLHLATGIVPSVPAARVWFAMGILDFKAGKLEKARYDLEQAVSNFEKIDGTTRELATALESLAAILRNLQLAAEAQSIEERARKIRTGSAD